MKNNEDQPAALSKIRPGQQKGRLKPVFFVSNTATTSTTCHLTAAAITNHEQRSTYLAPGNRHCVRRLIAKARGGRHELRVVQGFATQWNLKANNICVVNAPAASGAASTSTIVKPSSSSSSSSSSPPRARLFFFRVCMPVFFAKYKYIFFETKVIAVAGQHTLARDQRTSLWPRPPLVNAIAKHPFLAATAAAALCRAVL
ncbi:hypothetical protein TW95_gp0907 [Pandoravirus inopinatum]|uniref:Uncharacterized protein n=1 Tax=Pandoravirus inopinatum TaxID=1605721 RepID=A0A0B5J9T4_9VIRU|nr:hypothetical protein TW95_gp0907 [Pandoravirus inopinatum]AJF97641.1 hypothetical protein [Pandoravirus inopinatum]